MQAHINEDGAQSMVEKRDDTQAMHRELRRRKRVNEKINRKKCVRVCGVCGSCFPFVRNRESRAHEWCTKAHKNIRWH